MFSKEIYINRRAELLRRMSGQGGIAIFPGNADAPANYRGNDYKFRQESTFLYFWGIDQPFYAAVLDLDTGGETIFADDVDIDDIVWMGPQPSVRSIAESVGVGERSGAAAGEVSAPYAGFADYVKKAVAQGRKVHFLPQSRYYNCLLLSSLLNIDAQELNRRLPASKVASEPLARAVIGMRLVKQECEIEEIDKSCNLGIRMHTAAREGCVPGVLEQSIVGRMDGITLSEGWGVSFTTILSQNGETLHNHRHDQIITPGRLLLVDAGAEINTHYASDFTRTYPCSGKFTTKQREIYDIVHQCNEFAFSMVRPGISYREVHIATVTRMLEGLKSLGIVNGDPAQMAADGIGGLFM
ncbi:MAG: aminopeptidase P N-terminal domain-containing protein, partial [Candidatus Cryptobacteroides sp.]|nr:aminopeptidase P N-terminal domain-containing protein [Candidatus Cryptobacteroides sp.]